MTSKKKTTTTRITKNTTPRKRTKKIQEPEVDAACVHHWMIDPSYGPVSDGKCKKCGEDRRFYNSIQTGGAFAVGHVSTNVQDRRLDKENLVREEEQITLEQVVSAKDSEPAELLES